MTIRDRGASARIRGAAALATVLLASSCLYDSSWADPKRAQQAAAQRATPSALRATPQLAVGPDEATSKKHSRRLQIRAHATPRYAAEVVDWQRQLADLLADANEVLGPTVSVRLELTTAEVWAPRGADDDLLAMLDEVSEREPGARVEWVVGLIGSVPRFERSFHQLGLGRTGKHFVVRAMNDAREYEAIENNLSKLDDQERHKLYRVRKRHKTTAVFLHELGHTLGVIHELDRTTLMAPVYDPKEEGFSVGAAEWMRISLDQRLDPAAKAPTASGQTLLDHLQKTASSWVPAERDELVARLQAQLATSSRRTSGTTTARPNRGPGPGPGHDPGASPPAAPADLAALGVPDRSAFDEATEALRAGQPREAWSRAKPLFTAYPDVATVQDPRRPGVDRRGTSGAHRPWTEPSAERASTTSCPPSRRTRSSAPWL